MMMHICSLRLGVGPPGQIPAVVAGAAGPTAPCVGGSALFRAQ